MILYCLIFQSLIIHFTSISAQVTFVKMIGQFDTKMADMKQQIQSTSVQSMESGVTTGLKPWKGQSNLHRRHHLKNVHGILNIFGWGFLLPAGVIIARNFRKFPLKCEEWYNLHILFQTSGYIIGAVGWAIGIWLGNSSKQYSVNAHRILGIIIFTLATIQMLALWLQPKAEEKCRKWWRIYHQFLGYALIILSIANIFQGIKIIQNHAAEKWKWFYVGILIVLASSALALEIYRWIKSKDQKRMQMGFDENEIYASEHI